MFSVFLYKYSYATLKSQEMHFSNTTAFSGFKDKSSEAF